MFRGELESNVLMELFFFCVQFLKGECILWYIAPGLMTQLVSVYSFMHIYIM